YGRAHYLLGSLLARQVRPDALEKAPEAARHLRLGLEDVPRGRLEIAQIYLAEGDRLGAAEELRQYLKTRDTSARPEAQRRLAELTVSGGLRRVAAGSPSPSHGPRCAR